jgi:AcrR family transcriptional regulator
MEDPASTDDAGDKRVPVTRGRRRTLRPEQVVEAALEIVDEGGPAALSIRAVAGRLGVNPNAIYTYVDSRAALEREVVESVLADSDVALLSGGAPWRTRIVDYAVSLRASLLRHPAAALLMMTAPMNGPSALLVGEGLIETLIEAGISQVDAARASYVLIVQVVGFTALEVAETDGKPPLAAEAERIDGRREALAGLDEALWPRTAATKDVAAQWISTGQFTWSLDLLLDGLVTRPLT